MQKPVSNDRERGVRSFAWCPDNRHIVYPQDSGGDENWHLHVVDLEDGGDVDVTPFDGVQARILAADRRQPHHLLIGLNRRNPELHDAYLLDVRDGSLELAAENPGFAGWLVDTELRVRGGMAFLPDGGVEIRVGDPATGDYRTLLAVGSEDAISTDVAGFTHAGDAIYLVTSKDANAARLAADGRRHRRLRGARRGSDLRRLRRPDRPRHAPRAGGHVHARAGRPRRARRCVARRRRGHARAAPGRPALPRPRPRRPDLDRRLHRRRRAGGLLRLRPAERHGELPLRAQARPARSTRSRRWSRSASPPATAWRCTATSRSRPAPTARAPRRCSSCTAARGRATSGALHPTRSGSPTAATCACR